MAYTNGTAANYKDLLAAMVTFATANGWVALEQSETKVFMKGTGLAGLDEIYVGIETYENPTSGIFNWNLTGAWGYRAGRAYNRMPHNSNLNNAELVVGHFWNTGIDYWISANARRVILFAKVGTTYQSIYFGFLNQLGTEAQYPYPLFLGGASNVNTKGYNSTQIGHYWGRFASSYYSGRLHNVSGAWGTCYTDNNGNETRPIFFPLQMFPYFQASLLTSPDGSYLIDPIYLAGSGRQIFGQIDGVFRVTGYNNTSENIITVDGVNYMVFQDASLSGVNDFCCMRMN